jgi:hypothetical protein
MQRQINPSPQGHFLSSQGYRRYFTVQIKRKGKKNPLTKDHFFLRFQGQKNTFFVLFQN